MSFRCICPFLPGRQRPHIRRHTFGTPKILPIMQLQSGIYSRGCSHSIMFRLPHSLDPQVALTAEAQSLQGGRAVYTTHSSIDYSPGCGIATHPTRVPPRRECGWTFTSWIAALSAAPTSPNISWDFIDHGIQKSYLKEEYNLTFDSRESPPCNVGNCTKCGVCD